MTSQTVLLYLLRSILISGLFLAYYWVALRDKKFHYYNRFYLLSSSIISLIAPLLNFDWFTVEEPVLINRSSELIQFVLPTTTGYSGIHLDWADYILVTACIITMALLGLLLQHILKIKLLKRKNDVTPMDGFDFINTNEENAPFTFLNNLFWKKSISLQEEGGQQIFKHEITHIQQKHTWDRIYCQIISSIFWMNPFNWIIQKELVTIHEFIADEAAVGNSNTEAFAKMLLQTHYGNHFLNPTHQFFYSSIKRRLTMLTKSTNTKYSYLRRVMVLPILIASVCLVSIKVNASEKIGKKVAEIKNDFSLLVSDTTKPAKKSSVKSPPAPPTPPTPPAPPKVNKTDSKGNKFTVTSKYAVDTFDVVSDANYHSNRDTFDVVRDAYYNGNKNKNAFSNVIFTTKDKQVALAELEKNANVVIEKKTENGTEKYIIVDNQAGKAAIKPAFYLEGVKITEKGMKAVSPNDIESINVLKGEQAIKKYSEDGKNGVVEIKLKKKN